MTEYFSGVSQVRYEGKDSDNPLAFKHYNPEEMIDGKSLKDHLRFAVAFWHSYQGRGADPFGPGTAQRSWDHLHDPLDAARARMDANFEFCQKLGLPFFCFHDRDIAPEGATLAETNKNLDKIVAHTKELMASTGVRLLWGTANLFSHPRFVHGAATAPNAEVFAYAAAQVKKALEATLELGGANYVFWGGREGYETLLNTDTKLEQDNLARFLHMAVDYAREIGFKGQFLIEPKPKEPTKHQYDFDTATVIAFLKTYGLDKYFKTNIEANHATLAGHTFQHELRVSRQHGMLGSIDANQGDAQLGWDTDQFPVQISETTLAMYEVILAGGFTSGGLNFDAKVRRASFEPEDLFYSHIGGMDSFALGFKIAHKMVKDGRFEQFIAERYASYREGIGLKIVEGQVGFKELEQYALSQAPIRNRSGRQEFLENFLNHYLYASE